MPELMLSFGVLTYEVIIHVETAWIDAEPHI